MHIDALVHQNINFKLIYVFKIGHHSNQPSLNPTAKNSAQAFTTKKNQKTSIIGKIIYYILIYWDIN